MPDRRILPNRKERGKKRIPVVTRPPTGKLEVMDQVKDTRRAQVRITYDGRVLKTFRGHQAAERFANEWRVLKYLEEKGCPFVPRVLEAHPDQLLLITTNAGQRVEHLSEAKMNQLFAELERYGVRHEDRAPRNITYHAGEGRFCVIDFEFARILDDPHHQSPMPWNPDEDPLPPASKEHGGSAGPTSNGS